MVGLNHYGFFDEARDDRVAVASAVAYATQFFYRQDALPARVPPNQHRRSLSSPLTHIWSVSILVLKRVKRLMLHMLLNWGHSSSITRIAEMFHSLSNCVNCWYVIESKVLCLRIVWDTFFLLRVVSHTEGWLLIKELTESISLCTNSISNATNLYEPNVNKTLNSQSVVMRHHTFLLSVYDFAMIFKHCADIINIKNYGWFHRGRRGCPLHLSLDPPLCAVKSYLPNQLVHAPSKITDHQSFQ